MIAMTVTDARSPRIEIEQDISCFNLSLKPLVTSIGWVFDAYGPAAATAIVNRNWTTRLLLNVGDL